MLRSHPVREGRSWPDARAFRDAVFAGAAADLLAYAVETGLWSMLWVGLLVAAAAWAIMRRMTRSRRSWPTQRSQRNGLNLP
jgi:Flp pilus assembly protein TadB